MFKARDSVNKKITIGDLMVNANARRLRRA
jgi:hypothetical protein